MRSEGYSTVEEEIFEIKNLVCLVGIKFGEKLLECCYTNLLIIDFNTYMQLVQLL